MSEPAVRAGSAARPDTLPVSNWHRRTVIVGEVFRRGVLAAVLAEQWQLDCTGTSTLIAAALAGVNVMSQLRAAGARRGVGVPAVHRALRFRAAPCAPARPC